MPDAGQGALFHPIVLPSLNHALSVSTTGEETENIFQTHGPTWMKGKLENIFYSIQGIRKWNRIFFCCIFFFSNHISQRFKTLMDQAGLTWKWRWKSLSCVWFFVTPWTVVCQAPLSMVFPRQEYWSGLPFPSQGHLSSSGIEPASLILARGFFTTEPPGKSNFLLSGT